VSDTRGRTRHALESQDDFEPDEEYETLQRRLEEVFTALDELVATFDGDDFRAEFATCELGGRRPSHTVRASVPDRDSTNRSKLYRTDRERIPISGADSQGRIHRYTRRIRTARYSVQYIRPWALGRPMSQESEYTEGDLRNTGMSLKHDREWDYELEEIVEAIEERDAKKVGLQFPRG